jgi:enoyl-CoA hydratase
MPTELRYEEQDHVGVITLDRPEARNALTVTTYAELEHAVRSTTALDTDWHELGAWVSASLGELFQTADHREGVAAFLEMRPARYVGR